MNLTFKWFCEDFYTGGKWIVEHFSKVSVSKSHHMGRTFNQAEQLRQATMLEF